MADEKFDRHVAAGPGHVGDGVADYRTRMEALQAQGLKHWHQQLAEQTSTLNSPADRIRIWERRHQIDLPRDPRHRLVGLIAADTGLSIEDVFAEQQLRAAAPTSESATP